VAFYHFASTGRSARVSQGQALKAYRQYRFMIVIRVAVMRATVTVAGTTQSEVIYVGGACQGQPFAIGGLEVKSISWMQVGGSLLTNLRA